MHPKSHLESGSILIIQLVHLHLNISLSIFTTYDIKPENTMLTHYIYKDINFNALSPPVFATSR